eukprot:6189484-Pleurochrysis_carterae.AAC.1
MPTGSYMRTSPGRSLAPLKAGTTVVCPDATSQRSFSIHGLIPNGAPKLWLLLTSENSSPHSLHS